jgi:orotate phosphoribosyltransferase
MAWKRLPAACPHSEMSPPCVIRPGAYCRAAYTEKTKDGGMDLLRFKIEPGSNVLVPEDTTTTGGTSMMTARVLKNLGCNIIPVIPTLVSRMAEDEIVGPDNTIFKVACLAKLIFRTWKVQNGETCELCDLGSKAFKPKANWDRFRMDC